jgi:NAD(P)H-dependent flavin oxidoreductase YrpB (nitropropane dioxygenase family)
MSNLKPIYVTLKEGRHKTQPWTFSVDRPGPQKGETKRERYATMRSAKRGAARKLAQTYRTRWELILQQGTVPEITKARGITIRPVKFIIDKRK